MSSSIHIDNKEKDILVLRREPTQGLGENSLTAEIYQFKAKDSIVAGPLCLGNISKSWSSSNMKKTGLNGYIYEFSIDYSNNNTKDATPYVHKYLISKYDIV